VLTELFCQLLSFHPILTHITPGQQIIKPEVGVIRQIFHYTGYGKIINTIKPHYFTHGIVIAELIF
jgi:hypothetical protein